MSEWQEIPFYKLLEEEKISYGIVQPGTHKLSDYVPVIRVNNLKSGRIETEDVLQVASEIERKHIKTRLKGGELLVSVVGNPGECAIVPLGLNGWNVARAISVARIKESFSTKFIYYSFKTEDIKHQMYGNINDTVQPTLNLTELKELKFNLPTLQDQQAIAEVLSSLDDKIDLLHRNNKTLEEMAETLFRQWFVESSDINIVEEKALSSICKVLIGRTPPRNEHIWFTTPPNGINWMSIKDLGNAGTYITSTREALTQEAINRHNIPVIPKNTVVLSFKLTVGRVSITGSEMISNEAIAQFQIEEDSPINYIYLYSFLKSYNYQSMGSTSSIAEAVNSRMIKEILCTIPTQQSLLEYTDLVNPIFSKILNSSKQIQELSNLRDSLLPKLMTGQVVVS
jgi:type I restriction enzyme S subunit